MSKATAWIAFAQAKTKARPRPFAEEMADPDSVGTLERKREVFIKPVNSFGRPAMTLLVGGKEVFSVHAADALQIARWILDTFGEAP